MRVVLIAAVSVMIPATTAVAQCSDADKASLEQLDRAWGAATLRGDRAYLQSLYADDYTGATYTGTQGKASAIDDAVRAAEANRANPQNVPRLSYDNYVITCTPNSATLTHRNVVTTTAGGKETTSYSRSVHVFEKRGGRWQVVGNAGHALPDGGVLAYMESDWNEAERKRDASWFERNLADDATLIGSRTGALESKSQYIASIRNDKSQFDSIELSELAVRVDGNAAVVTGVNRVRGKDEQGRPMDRRLRFTDTFVKRDGRWLVLASQGTTIP